MGPWGGLVSDIEVRKYVVTWPGEFVRASNGDIGTLQICMYFCMFWVLFFSEISINWVINGKNSNEFCWIINNIYFVSTCKFFYRTNCLRVSFRLPKKGTDPPLKWRVKFVASLFLTATAGLSVAFFPVMFHINKSYLKLSFHWYQYWYVYAIL